MALERDFQEMANDIVTMERYESSDLHNKKLYGSPISYQVQIIRKPRMIRSNTGDTAMAAATITFMDDYGFGLQDQITLSNGKKPPIVSVIQIPDEYGRPYYQQVLI